jgi:SpoVK/Ycf46/Vps4 family AAA+-type ATPase
MFSGREIKDFLNKILSNKRSKNKDDLKEIIIEDRDIEEAKNIIEEKKNYLTKIEFQKKHQNTSFKNNIFGYWKEKKALNQYIQTKTFTMQCTFSKIIKPEDKHVVLFGPAGTGKTNLANTFISEFISKIEDDNNKILESYKEIIDAAIFEVSPDSLTDLNFIDNIKSQAEQLSKEGYIVFILCNEINGLLNIKYPNCPLRTKLINSFLEDPNFIVIGTSNTKLTDKAISRRFE